MGLEKNNPAMKLAAGSCWLQRAAGALALVLGVAGVCLGRALPAAARYPLGALGIALLGAATALLYKGLRTRKLLDRLGEIEKLMGRSRRLPLEMVCEHLGCPLSRLVADVREMQKRGWAQGLYADLIRKDLVSVGKGVDPDPPAQPDDDIVLREVRGKSAAPIYLLGLSWVAYAAAFPLYRWADLLVAALFSALVYVTAARRCPERVEIAAQRKPAPPRPDTGNEALDELLSSAQRHMDNLRRLDRDITAGKVDEAVRDILRTTEQIIEHVQKNPGAAGQIRQFFNYTLPTTIGLLQNYDELCRQPVKTGNIEQSMARIEDMMDNIVAAFRRQLDALFREKALDIEVELDVMKDMLAQNAPGAAPFDGTGQP